MNLQEAELTGLRQQMDSKQAETQIQRNLETEFKSRLIESERRVLEARGLLDEARNAEKDAKAAKQKVEERMEAKERAPKQSTSDMEQTLLVRAKVVTLLPAISPLFRKSSSALCARRIPGLLL